MSIIYLHRERWWQGTCKYGVSQPLIKSSFSLSIGDFFPSYIPVILYLGKKSVERRMRSFYFMGTEFHFAGWKSATDG